MAHSGTNRMLAAKGGYPVQDFGSLRRQKMRKKEETGQKSAPTNTIVVEQWICFVLGFACIAFGAWGIFMRTGQGALSRHIAWLGSLYAPSLRVTAVACFGLGLVLIRRGWSHL
jgi:hypothetical protein